MNELLPDVLRSLHGSGLDKVLVAPLVLEAMHFPRLVHNQHGQVVSVLVVELRPFLVCELLLFPWTIEHVLN